MPSRSYRQYCGLAMALDVVAERWALLIVRDLAPGPRRYNDLFAGLPGISTDMLAERLRSLEAAGAVTSRQLRDPVPAKVYELTERGQELAEIVGSLAVWGLGLLPAPTDTDFRLSARWTLQSMCHRYSGGLADAVIHWTIDDVELTLTISPERAALRYGHHDTPTLTVNCPEQSFLRMVSRPPSPDGAPPKNVQIVGPSHLLAEVFAAMSLRAHPSPGNSNRAP
jgi:DNA-binding HxlR family transcriptional regulator